MSSFDDRHPAPSTAITAAGLDHVRLSYLYLDSGDIDGYGSLLDEHAQVYRPDAPHGNGRAEILRLHTAIGGPSVRHHIYKIVADGDCVAVIGRSTQTTPPTIDASGRCEEPSFVEFADFFTLSDDGMLLGYRRFYFAPPA